MNGSPLGYTANVIEAAYVGGHLWQENSSGLWWEYQGSPSAPWTGLGTSTDPLPSGTLNFGPGTETQTLTGGGPYTIHVAATEYTNGDVPANDMITLTKANVTADFTATGGIGDASGEGDYTNPATVTVNFAKTLTLSGMDASAGDLTFNGTKLDNDGTSYLDFSHAHINADVVGTGSWNFSLTDLTLNGTVGSGQTFNDGYGGPAEGPSSVTIEKPSTFHGLLNVAPYLLDFGSVTLADLTATSYSYTNDTLKLYSGNKVVDSLKFTDNNTFGVYQSAGGVVISSNQEGTAIPLHTTGV
jgi:hypothetical protein